MIGRYADINNINEIKNLKQGFDFREPKYRREVFLRFYEYHIKYKSHPGAVYYTFPYIFDKLNMSKGRIDKKEIEEWLIRRLAEETEIEPSEIILTQFHPESNSKLGEMSIKLIDNQWNNSLLSGEWYGELHL